MNKAKCILLSVFLCEFFASCKGQKPFGTGELTPKQTIALTGVKGRIDHLDINPRDQIDYIAALGNHSLEVVDLKTGKHLHSIKGLEEPQGVAFIPQTNEIIVADGGNGNCHFYNAQTFQNTATIHLNSDADDVRYDSAGQKIYIGYGNGGIAVIDAQKHEKIADVQLPAHPEGFQLDKRLDKLFVNVPESEQIDVIDLKNWKVSEKWKTTYGANFPMAIDPVDHILFIGYRHPGKLVALDAVTGKTITTADLITDVDDLYFDSRTKKVYASGGGGAINVYLFNNSQLKQVANIPTRNGARTSLLVPSLNIFVLAERASEGKEAQLQIFTGD